MNRALAILLVAAALSSSACALSQAERNRFTYHYEMGQSFYAENNVTGALVEFTEAERISPRDPKLLNFLGLAFYRKGRYGLAEEKFKKALREKPSFSEARNNLGVDYMEMKRWDDAIAQFRLVRNDIFYPDQTDAEMNLGLAYLGKGEYREALPILRTVAERSPRDFRAPLNLGRVYFAMGRTELAIGEYRKSLKLNDRYANAYYNLALAELKIQDQSAARSAFREVVRIAPDSEIGQLSSEYLDMLK